MAQISALRKAIEVPPECKSTDHVALAYTHVRLVLQLLRISVADAAATYFGEARRLRPNSQNIRSRAADSEASGCAARPESWEPVEALDDHSHDLPVDVKGIAPKRCWYARQANARLRYELACPGP